MRILLVWASKYPETENLISSLKKEGHEVVYWVGGSDDRKFEVPAGIITHTYKVARMGVPATGVNVSDFPPPDEDLIRQLHEAESLILTMMNKQFDWMCTDERRHFYYNMLQYWNGVIKKYRPEVVIFSLVPHSPFSYVIYALAQLFKIRMIIFDTVSEIGVPYSDRMLMHINTWKESESLQKALNKNKDKNFSLEDIEEDLRIYYQLHATSRNDPTPLGVKEDQKLYSSFRLFFLKIKVLVKSFRDLTFFEKTLGYLQKLFHPNLKQEYASLQKEPDLNKKFVYAPLHYQPECSTSPQGDLFVDQILMIETLSASLPEGWIIYVKEHPVQWLFRGLNFFGSRYRGYYKRIASLKNTQLVPVKTDHYSLVGASRAIAAITGSTGFEALIRSKPSIVFGYPWYRHCHGIFKVNGSETCRTAFEKIEAGFLIDQSKIINYLKSFDEASTHGMGALSEIIGNKLKKSKLESMNNIIQAILSELKTKKIDFVKD